MKRGGPLKRTSTISSGQRAPLRSRSAKRSKVMRETRAPQVRELIESGVRCQVSPILERAGIRLLRCGGQITGLHERRKRSSGGSLVNPENTIPACSWCNGFIEDEPELVRELTGTALVVREGDPEWGDLGSRNDRFR